MSSIKRRDFTLRSAEGADIAIHEVRPARLVEDRVPLMLMHGAERAADDIDMLAEDLAHAGHDCFVIDASDFGNSRPSSWAWPPAGSASLLRNIEIARDIDTVAGELRAVTGLSKIGIVQRGVPIGMIYAALWPERISHLVLSDGPASRCHDGTIDAASIYCRVMIIDADREGEALGADLIHAQEVRLWQPKDPTQGVFRYRPELSRNEGMLRLLTFLQ